MRLARDRFFRWLHAPITPRRQQRQILTLAIALLITTLITIYAFLHVYSLGNELREASVRACERGNPVREAVRNNARALSDLIEAINVPPSNESFRHFVLLREYVQANPNDPVAVYLYQEVRDRYENRTASAEAFEIALRNLNAVTSQARQINNCEAIVNAEN